MLDHLGIFSTPELHEATVAFYVATLEPLGYKKAIEFYDGKVVGLGVEGARADFWVSCLGPNSQPKTQATNAHYAFASKDQSTVDECYAKGIAAGGKDNGAPGLRPHYHPKYYGAFMVDPVGNTMEIVNHGA